MITEQDLFEQAYAEAKGLKPEHLKELRMKTDDYYNYVISETYFGWKLARANSSNTLSECDVHKISTKC